MRLFVSTVLAAALFASAALAADVTLTPGKPAGVKRAQMTDNSVVIGLGVAVIGAGAAIAAASGNNHNVSSATTTSSTAP